ncbi:MAG: zinc ABC transporter substrate-binding protein [Clostridia bacterium]|nr:zinc ABC transporter substrate-binding protein [Clostridia bacterium]
MSKRIVKFVSLITVAVVLLSALVACNSSERQSGFTGDKLKVVCTVYSVYDFASNILGDEAEIKLIMTPGTDVHGFEPSSDDMRLMEDCDVIIYSGAGLEMWLDDVVKALDNKSVKLVDCSRNVDILDMEESVTELFENEEDEHHHHEGNDDPHIWLSPKNACIEAETIYDQVSVLITDEDAKAGVRENYEEYKADLEQLVQDYDAVLGDLSGEKMIVSHEAFGYLCHEYGIEQIAIDGLTSGESDARLVSQIIEYIRENNVSVIFYEDLVNPDTAKIISEETGCELVPLRALGSLSEDEASGGMDYLKAMRENLEALKILG